MDRLLMDTNTTTAVDVTESELAAIAVGEVYPAAAQCEGRPL